MKRKLIIFGNNRFAAMVAHGFQAHANCEVVAFTAHSAFITEARLDGRPLLPFETIAEQFPPDTHEFFVALEHGRQNAGRAEVAATATALGYRLASFISPSAHISSHAQLGEHCLILENVVIQHGAVFGANNFIHANSFFGQSCRVGGHNYFGSGFFADRHASLGSYSVFGSQVRIAESLVIRDWANIQAFETIRESLPLPTLIHPVLRTPGHVVDKRRASS